MSNPGGLKILVSAVRFRPWARENQQTPSVEAICLRAYSAPIAPSCTTRSTQTVQCQVTFDRGGRHAYLPTNGGAEIRIDADLAADLGGYQWYLDARGYPIRHLPRSEGGGKEYLHRRVLSARPGDVVDHIDGNLLDATRNNLRITDPLGNVRNTIRSKRRARGQYKGVYFVRKSGRWAACIGAGDRTEGGRAKRISLGCYATEIEAAEAYDRAAVAYFGKFAALNFPAGVTPPAPQGVAAQPNDAFPRAISGARGRQGSRRGPNSGERPQYFSLGAMALASIADGFGLLAQGRVS